MSDPPPIASTTEVGKLGVYHLKRLWSSTMAVRNGAPPGRDGEEFRDKLLINALGLGLHQANQKMFCDAPTFDEFESWIVETVGTPDKAMIERINAEFGETDHPEAVRKWLEDVKSAEPVLSEEDLTRWDENGFIVLERAVDLKSSSAAEKVIWDFVGANPNDPETWYQRDVAGIMVELIQNPALEANRRSDRIHKAFSQLWGAADLWVTADRCGFHPPQRENFPFPGPDLHWDLDFDQPIVFGTQGILYLTDTPPEQGALTVVPGFHKRLPDWLETLDPDCDPQQQDLHSLGSQPVGGKAGDMVIWHQSLPHGSRPNLGNRPRIVQYINMLPGFGRKPS